jgi:acyl carrier protein
MTVSLEEIKKIAALRLGLMDIDENAGLVENLGAESAEIIGIIASIEETFNVTFDEMDIPKMKNLKDLFLHTQKLVQSSQS